MKRLFLFFTMLFFIVGCGTPKVQREFETVLKALKEGKIEKIEEINSKSKEGNEKDFAEDEKLSEVLKEGYKKMSYKIKNTKVEGDSAIINIDLKTPNLAVYFPEYFQKAMIMAFANMGKSEEELRKMNEKMIDEFFMEKLNSKDLEYNDQNIDVVFHKKNNKWEVDGENENNKQFMSLITFGFYEIFESFGKMSEEMQ